VAAKPRREGILADWLDEAAAAAEVGKTIRTLRDWRKRGIGAPYSMFGRTAKYHKDALRQHFLEQQVTPVRAHRPREGPRRSAG
jgi:hypothetical protein